MKSVAARDLATLGGMMVVLVASCSRFSDATGPAVVDASTSDEGGSMGVASARCPSMHYFCDDFEAPTLSNWKVLGDTPAIAERLGGGHALVAEVPAGGDRRKAWVEAELSSKQLDISFDLFIADLESDPKDISNNFRVVSLGFEAGGKVYSAALYASTGSRMELTYEVPTLGARPMFTFVFGRWNHVRLQILFGPSGSIVVTVDQKTEASVEIHTPSAAAILQLGLYRPNGQTPKLHVEYDNLIVDELSR